jgi:dTDP-4-amino-4,6-dideoxygalactose transaminase
MHVPLLDLRAQYALLKRDIERVIGEVCETQQFVLGPQVEALEASVSAYCQSRFGIGVSSGTDALLLALMALGIGPGDEVVTTPYTFFATGGVVARLGARPVFCDIEASTFNLSADAVRRFIEDGCRRDGDRLVNRATEGRVKALMPVHLYGQMAEMEPLVTLAEEHALHVVEDAAQAIGSELPDGRRAGSIGDVGCLSFFPTKNLGAFGDAGMCVTQSPELAEKMRILRVHGGEPKYYHSVIGGNFRLDALQAAVLRVKLEHLDAWTAARQSNAAHYTRLIAAAGLSDRVAAPPEIPGGRHIFNQYVIRCGRRDELRTWLSEQGVGTEIYYPVSLHEQRCFEYLGYSSDDLPNASKAASETLALPVYPELTPEQREYVVRAIGEFFAGPR